MGLLQESFDREVAKLPKAALRESVKKKLARHHIRITPRKLDEFIDRALAGETRIVITSRNHKKKNLTIRLNFSRREIDTIVKRLDRVIDRMPKIVDDSTSSVAQRLLPVLEKRWPQESWVQQEIRSEFERRLQQRWGRPLGLLRMLLVLALEFGGEINAEARLKDDQPHLVDVLTRLHARACQVTEEIIRLLYAGLADGAMARWRTLYEIATVGYVVLKFGEKLAERYVAHDAVESFKASIQFQRHAKQLAQNEITASKFKELEDAYNGALAKYGPAFRGQYGWAAESLEKERPTFDDLVEAAGIGHLRPYYKLASHNIHSNPRGVFYKLGLYSDSRTLLAGPSNFGLADPGSCTALALVQISTVLLHLNSNVDHVVGIKVMQLVLRKINGAFGGAHAKMVKLALTDLKKVPG